MTKRQAISWMPVYINKYNTSQDEPNMAVTRKS